MSPLSLHNLTLTWQRHPVVHHLSGKFHAGRLTALVGRNGAGKSTLLRAMAGLHPIHEGEIRGPAGSILACGDPVVGNGIHSRRRDAARIAYLPQQTEAMRDFPISVRDFVALGDWARSGNGGTVRCSVDDALAQVGLTGLAERPLVALSTGQFQRVCFARLLVQDAPVMLLDEPFAGVDVRTTADLLPLLVRWGEAGRTIIAALHDYEQVRTFFPDTLLLAREAIAWGPTAEVLTADNLARAEACLLGRDETHVPVCQVEEALSPALASVQSDTPSYEQKTGSIA